MGWPILKREIPVGPETHKSMVILCKFNKGKIEIQAQENA